MSKEASARIKINKLLEQAGWRFEADKNGDANIQLEPGVKISELGEDFEHTKNGFIDFLLLDKDKRPLVVVEAKKESIDPLSAKEQARAYARTVDARFIILSNGNIHYLWDTKHGNPETISRFPTQDSITQYQQYVPNPIELASTAVDENYIMASQMPGFAKDPLFTNTSTRPEFLKNNRLRQMRPYQVQAVKHLQQAAAEGKMRFLFEMATGTGKTLTSAAVIKLFLASGNARRILFLVDRIELENQAQKAFQAYLGKDYTSMVYKENKDSWQKAHIVVSTIQSFLAGDRYKKDFSPTDFELVISDEAHRSIGGNSRAVFEYFVGYKLGLTATPKDYLRGFDNDGANTQRDFERRMLLTTYTTFGCEPGEPTFRYALLDGVADGYLINPIVIDARTKITAQLLSDEGYAAHSVDSESEVADETYTARDYERTIFNEATNIAMSKALFERGMRDPVAEKMGVELFGKTIVFCVSQRHAARVTNILNKLASERWPERYAGSSDFAVQVTSNVTSAQQMTINFANRKLNGNVNEPEGYESDKTRVCVTVGMMTTGYDCEDLLNIALMRPVFSPSDFVQIKGRGTRKYQFELLNYKTKESFISDKQRFAFFDFFATCEYFEKDYPYDEKIKLPGLQHGEALGTEIDGGDGVPEGQKGPIDLASPDTLQALTETVIGKEGMRIDREGFKRAVDEDILGNEELVTMWKNGDYEAAEDFVKKYVLEKPKYFLSLEKIRKVFGIDRRISVREFLQVAFGMKEGFEMKDDLLELEWEKFQEINNVDQEHFAPVKSFFKAYIVDETVRDIIHTKRTARFHTESSFNADEYQKLNGFKAIVPQYVKDFVSLNTFMN